jgi:hypothetical protein
MTSTISLRAGDRRHPAVPSAPSSFGLRESTEGDGYRPRPPDDSPPEPSAAVFDPLLLDDAYGVPSTRPEHRRLLRDPKRDLVFETLFSDRVRLHSGDARIREIARPR